MERGDPIFAVPGLEPCSISTQNKNAQTPGCYLIFKCKRELYRGLKFRYKSNNSNKVYKLCVTVLTALDLFFQFNSISHTIFYLMILHFHVKPNVRVIRKNNNNILLGWELALIRRRYCVFTPWYTHIYNVWVWTNGF